MHGQQAIAEDTDYALSSVTAEWAADATDGLDSLELVVPVEAVTRERLLQLKGVLAANRGTASVRLVLQRQGVFEVVIDLPLGLKVAVSNQLLDAVDEVFGMQVSAIEVGTH